MGTKKNLTSFTRQSKGTTDFTRRSKIITDFKLNSGYDASRTLYNSASRTYNSTTERYSGVDPTLSPIIDKNQTDFTRGTKIGTDFSLNQAYDATKVDYNDSSILYGSSAVSYAGVTAGLSPIGTKTLTDYTRPTKNVTNWDRV